MSITLCQPLCRVKADTEGGQELPFSSSSPPSAMKKPAAKEARITTLAPRTISISAYGSLPWLKPRKKKIKILISELEIVSKNANTYKAVFTLYILYFSMKQFKIYYNESITPKNSFLKTLSVLAGKNSMKPA